MQTSEYCINLPPLAPVSPIIFSFFTRATAAAYNTFFEFPDVEIPSNTSPSFP
jgi:hypothetical protein